MISQRGRYALKALLRLAREPGASLQVRAISAEENIPQKFLEGIMSNLRRAGLVDSTRGAQGGYRLARAPEAISFSEVMRYMDGPLALYPCVSVNFYQRCADCPDEGACALRRVLATVRCEVTEVLDRTTLADALAGFSPLDSVA